VLDFGFIAQFLPAMLRGLEVTVEATLGGYAIALIVGLGLALGRRAKMRAVRAACGLYVDFMRCTPLLDQLYIAF
jgi:polar amino acid transport system permease protein